MINIVTGPPRSGKTYFLTYWIWKNYLTFDKEFLKWTVKNNAVIVSNVEGWVFPYKNLDEILKNQDMTPEQFFTLDVQKELAETHNTILYIIDEAHKYFPLELGKKSIASKGLRDYFAFHGHYNQHFWLATQDVSLIFPSLVKLAETEYQAVRKSISPPGRFRYHLRVPGKHTKISKIVLRKDKIVYSLYRTADKDETEKPVRTKAYLLLYVLMSLMVVLIVLFAWKIKSFGDNFKGKNKVIPKSVEVAKNKKVSGQKDSKEQKSVAIIPINKKYDVDIPSDMSWQRVIYLTDRKTKKIKIYDPVYKEFVFWTEYEHQIKVINNSIFALLKDQQEDEKEVEGVATAEPTTSDSAEGNTI